MTALTDDAIQVEPEGRPGNRRRRTAILATAGLLAVVAVLVVGTLVEDHAARTDLGDRNQGPSAEHLFGTDRLGHDLLARVLVGLRLSLLVGTTAAFSAAVIAFVLASLAITCGRWVEAAVNWLVDLFLALPHLVLLILIAFALGGGTRAVVIAVAVSHWPSLTRVLLAQGRAVVASDYVAQSRALGRGTWFIASRHLFGHLVPQFLVGAVLLFPHAILHEAALSFLGLGVDPGQPAVGILLAESMRSLSSGMWWLAVLPGVSLLVLVKIVDGLGANLRALTDPRSYHL